MSKLYIYSTALLLVLASNFVAAPARSENTTLYVKNNTGDYITVNVDGNYGCNTSSGSTCSIPVTVDSHKLHAKRHDTGATKEKEQTITSNGYTWEPW